MKIGLIGDTHIPNRAKEIPENFLKILNGSDIIIHTGDVNDYNVIEELSKLTSEIKVVRGNTDYLDLKEEYFIEIDGKKFFIFHSDIIYPRGDLKLMYDYILNTKKIEPDFVIFGHTHVPLFTQYNGIYFINPGSATGVRSGEYLYAKRSIAILYTNPFKIEFYFDV